MKAIVQRGFGSPDVLELRDIDTPIAGADSVLVRVRAASVNAGDWHTLRHRLLHFIGVLVGFRSRRNPVPGVDLAGCVEAVGARVTRFTRGDQVFGVGLGTFAEYAVGSERRLAAMPRGLTFEDAAAIPAAGVTALQGLRDKAHVQPGQRVLVYGAGGGVGTFAVQIAKALGAHVTAVSKSSNVDRLRAIGADETIDYTKEDFTSRRQQYDVVFDLGGNRPLADCLAVLRPAGTLLLVGTTEGVASGMMRALKGRLMSLTDGRRVVAFVANITHDDLLALTHLVEAGKLSPVVDRPFSLNAAADAMRYLETGAAQGKVVITVQP